MKKTEIIKQVINSKLLAEVKLMEKVSILMVNKEINVYQHTILYLIIKEMVSTNSKRILFSSSNIVKSGACSKRKFFDEIKKLVDEKIIMKENTERQNGSTGINRYYLGDVFICDYKINWSKLK